MNIRLLQGGDTKVLEECLAPHKAARDEIS
jgi:hypothetical protein